MKKSILVIVVMMLFSSAIKAQFHKDFFSSQMDSIRGVNSFLSLSRSNPVYASNEGDYQKLDSVIRPDYYKDYYYYDDEGRIVKSIGDYVSDYYSDWMYDISYDSKGRVASYMSSTGDNSLNQWVYSYKDEVSYIDDLPSVSLSYFWTDNQWIVIGKYEFSYDQENNTSSEIGYSWDFNSSQWMKGVKNEYSYNTEGNPLTVTRLSWDTLTTQWKNIEKHEFTYNEDQGRTSYTISEWDSNAWVFDNKITYTYDAYGDMILFSKFYWNSLTSAWDWTTKYEYTYDTINRPILTLLYSIGDDDQWNPFRKIDYTYSYTCSPESLILPPFREVYYDEYIDITAASFTMQKWSTEENDWYITYTKDKYFSGITFLSVVVDSLTFSTPESGSLIFEILSSTDWNVSSDQDWISFSKKKGTGETSLSGTGNDTITITADENTTGILRSATITVTGTDVEDQIIIVTQNGVAQTLSVSSTSLSIASADKSTSTFIITSNTDWTISIADSWLLEDVSSGTGNDTITLTAQENTSTSSRETDVTVSGTGVSDQIITVIQNGVAQTLSVSETTLSIASPDNSNSTFVITSNTDWTISIADSWLLEDVSSGTGNDTITLTAQENTTTSSRTTNVTVSGTGVSDQTIMVTQEAGTTGISDATGKEFVIYPNPVNDFLVIQASDYKNLTIEITSLNGQVYHSNTMDGSIVQIDMTRFSKGVYFITVSSEEFVSTEKVIKL